MGHHREHQSNKIVGISMKSRGGGIPYGLQARKAPNRVPFLRLEACVSSLTSTGERRKKSRRPGGGAFRSLGNQPPLGFADRREAIPYGPMAKKLNAKGGAAFNAWPTNST